ncbi:MAG: GMP synthase (glutamine-hydrolyzing) [Cognaticolwellia sp.]|jgi:GMP synthase (glutamine-hydrolysing)
MRVLLVDNYLDPAGGTHNFAPHFSGVQWRHIRPTRAPLPSLDGVDAIVMTGSGANLADGYEGEGMRQGWTQELVDWTRQAVLADIPTLGVCFGHQVLGAAFGEGVGKATPPEVGYVEIQALAPDPLLLVLPSPFTCFVSHEDEVIGPGADLQVIASSALCKVQAVRVRGRPAWGIQFHAEMSQEEGMNLLKYRAEKHPELGLDIDNELAKAHLMAQVGPNIFARFLELAQEHCAAVRS